MYTLDMYAHKIMAYVCKLHKTHVHASIIQLLKYNEMGYSQTNKNIFFIPSSTSVISRSSECLVQHTNASTHNLSMRFGLKCLISKVFISFLLKVCILTSADTVRTL